MIERNEGRPDVRTALLDAVPELAAPPDRLGEVRRRAARLRVTRSTRVLLVGLVALAAIGGSLHAVSISGAGPPEASRSPSAAPSTWASDSGAPSGSASPGGSSPYRSPASPGGRSSEASGPASTGALIGPDFCPQTLMLRQPFGAGEVPYRTGAPQVTHVTLCRYRHQTFDLSVGPATLVSGPRRGNPSAVSSALRPILQPSSSANWNSEGCRYPWPQSDVVVDIAYAIDVHGRAATYALARIVCQNPWPDDPEIPLRAEVDRVLGPPY